MRVNDVKEVKWRLCHVCHILAAKLYQTNSFNSKLKTHKYESNTIQILRIHFCWWLKYVEKETQINVEGDVNGENDDGSGRGKKEINYYQSKLIVHVLSFTEIQ